MKIKLLFTCLLSLFLGRYAYSQQDAYSRGNSGTDLWWNDSAAPWYYVNWGNQNRPENWPIPTRNYLFIGHNSNTTMRVNGAYFGIASLTIQPSASEPRIYNAIDNGGIGITLGIYNNSVAQQTFNVPIRIDADYVKFAATNGPMVFNNPIYTEGRPIEFTDNNNTTVNGVIQQGGGVIKKGLGTVTFKGNNTYTGITTVESGILVLDALGGAMPSTNNITVKNTGQLKVSKNQTINNLSIENTATLVVESGAHLTVNGSLTVSLANSITLGAGASVNYGNSGTLIYNTNNDTAISNAEWPAINGPSSVTVTGGTVTASSGRTITGNLTVNGGVLDLSAYNFDRATHGGVLTVANGATLKIGGTATLPSNFATTVLGATSAVEYGGTAQTIAVLPSTQKYGHLVLSGSGLKTLGGNITAAGNLTVNAVALNVTSTQTLTVEGNMVNTGGNINFDNNANLLQGAATVANGNSGNVKVYRDGSALYRNDFTMWSSPVAEQSLFGFSPNTLANRFYMYNTASDQYNFVPGMGEGSSATFEAGKGYLIRMPNAGMVNGNLTGTTSNHNAYNADTAVMTFNGSFSGVPNNGTITVPLATSGNGYNLVGNPYPSPISISAFQAANTNAISGTIWIWRKKSVPANPNTAYVTINSAGIYAGNGQPEQEDPNNVLRTGQGFIVQLKPGYATSNLTFTNVMRSDDIANQFFRSVPGGNVAATEIPEAHGLWLNLTNASGIFSQMYTGYIEGATDGEDIGLDAPYIGDSATVLAALINDKDYTIQARALPFTPQAAVPLVMKVATAGIYTIAIDHKDGLFAAGQDIYLRDNHTGQQHDFSAGTYSFITDAGTFKERFSVEFVSDSSLSALASNFTDGSVIAYASGNAINVEATGASLHRVEIFDVRGRLLHTETTLGSNAAIIHGMNVQAQILIVRITTDKGIVTKKLAY